MDQYRPQRFQILPPVVKNLLILNGLFFLATLVLANQHIDLIDLLGLHYFESEKLRPYQFITYMFMHGGFWHIFLNMLVLWMFGTQMENYWGPKRFLSFYLFCGIGAAVTHYVIFYFEAREVIGEINRFIAAPDMKHFEDFFRSLPPAELSEQWQQAADAYNKAFAAGNLDAATVSAMEVLNQYKTDFLNTPTVVGASGAVYGILLAFGVTFPNTLIYIYFAIPIRAKYAVLIIGILELIGGISNQAGDNVAHFAHLGGMLFGFLLILYWRRNRNVY